ncbi:Uncharacterised protein [Burkholderia pseudomallei]|nr:Uncharacterised protein [Burkholderia pseudomallei]CAJ6714837.1 Uncharacterised protein [Burkholderia pseudomallei]
MTVEDFELGDLVEVTNLNPVERRVLCGTGAIDNGQRGIVTEKYREDFRVQRGRNAAMEWEANIRPDEVRLIERLGREEATARLRGV